MKKLRVALFFGGRSAEHEISVISARNIANALNKDKFEPVLVGITNSGKWLLFPDATIPTDLKRADDAKTASYPVVTIANLGKGECALINLGNQKQIPIDVGFAMMHGPLGEDGSIQGLFKIMGIPFVGSGVCGSAVGMDKDFMKRLLKEAQLPMARYRLLKPSMKISFDELVADLGLPFFIKPANMGSSVGVFKIKTRQDFETKIKESFKYDYKVLAEEFIKGREIEVAVLGLGENLIASKPGEIIPQHEFYSYEAKYLDENGALLKIPATLLDKQVAEAQELAKKVFICLGADGFARVDFFMNDAGSFYVNEINTLPGFTSISMYPKMMDVSGYPYPKLVEKLVELALERSKIEAQLQTQFPGAST